MKIAIVTGSSRGLGREVADLYLEHGFGLLTLARQEEMSFKEKAEELSLPYRHFSVDLSDSNAQRNVLEAIVTTLKETEGLEEIHLINNAGVVEPIEVVGNIDPQALQRLLTINVLAPMVFTNRLVGDFPTLKLSLVQISSGAANRPIHGWSSYGSSKAALNLFNETAALESDSHGTPHTFIAFNPGVMDTAMQGVIRAADQSSFRDVENFREYKEKGKLRSPRVVAEALVSLLLHHTPVSGKLYTINELLNNKE